MVVSITPQELHERLEKNPTVILDVRGVAAFDEWHVKHQNAEMLNIQTSKLKENGPEAYPQIPTDKEVAVICAKGNASKEASQILDERGYKVLNVEGGMQAWSEFYYNVPVTKSNQDDLELLQVIRPAKGCLSYMLVSGDEAIVVDAGRHDDYYSKLAADKGAKVRHVLDTHCHADHISGGPVLANQENAEYWISASEMQGSDMEFNGLTDGQTFKFGKATLQVLSIPTPGHTPGSVSFLVNNKYLLSGDTVFVSGIGRPDLGGKAEEWSELLYKTVRDKLSTLPDDVVILPAHFADLSEFTSEGYVGSVFSDIRSSNEFFQDMSEADFTDKMVQRAGQTPPNYTTIVQINRGEYAPTETERSELEVGPNRCAVKHLAG
ncbi:MBL fold metallo-hydrolase [Alicyclobacillus sp. SO9]|uniref:MBL fold metallo-hydrolase n=1 Tax=Alicyclobacillus sp. SO9 TaxID=2665646 RepID=UPI0018E72719|nr:MBL fold metallo-hydrolase [Alicyclobacillus sp. SO9]QQE79889.1 MBL fold metallo-hydrolase [Alicyclobacillus sp. SO9]